MENQREMNFKTNRIQSFFLTGVSRTCRPRILPRQATENLKSRPDFYSDQNSIITASFVHLFIPGTGEAMEMR